MYQDLGSNLGTRSRPRCQSIACPREVPCHQTGFQGLKTLSISRFLALFLACGSASWSCSAMAAPRCLCPATMDSYPSGTRIQKKPSLPLVIVLSHRTREVTDRARTSQTSRENTLLSYRCFGNGHRAKLPSKYLC